MAEDTGSKTDDTGKAPEFDGDFDEDKAKRAITNLRSEVASLKERNTALTAERDEFKAAVEKSGEERENAIKAALVRAEKAERELAISKHNLPEDVLKDFADYLVGTPEEVDAKAARLAARFGTAKDTGKDESDDKDGDEGDLPRRPAAKLTPGHGSAGDEDDDVEAAYKAASARR